MDESKKPPEWDEPFIQVGMNILDRITRISIESIYEIADYLESFTEKDTSKWLEILDKFSAIGKESIMAKNTLSLGFRLALRSSKRDANSASDTVISSQKDPQPSQDS